MLHYLAVMHFGDSVFVLCALGNSVTELVYKHLEIYSNGPGVFFRDTLPVTRCNSDQNSSSTLRKHFWHGKKEKKKNRSVFWFRVRAQPIRVSWGFLNARMSNKKKKFETQRVKRGKPYSSRVANSTVTCYDYSSQLW